MRRPDRQIGGRDLNLERALAVDQDVAGAVEDLAPGRRDPDLPGAVDLRLGQILVAGEDLQEPQTEEDDREQGEREAPDDSDAYRELRRERRSAFFRQLSHLER